MIFPPRKAVKFEILLPTQSSSQRFPRGRHFSADFSLQGSSGKIEERPAQNAKWSEHGGVTRTEASVRCGVRSYVYAVCVRRALKSNVDWNAIRGRAAIYTPKAPKLKKKSWQKTQAPQQGADGKRQKKKIATNKQHTEAAALGTLWPDSMGNLPTCASELFLFAIFEGGKCAALCSSPLNLSSRLSAKWQSENYSLCLRIRAQNRKPTKTERQTERNLERGVTSKWARDCQFPERQGARKRERGAE